MGGEGVVFLILYSRSFVRCVLGAGVGLRRNVVWDFLLCGFVWGVGFREFGGGEG